jgi:hypothetical protein
LQAAFFVVGVSCCKGDIPVWLCTALDEFFERATLSGVSARARKAKTALNRLSYLFCTFLLTIALRAAR